MTGDSDANRPDKLTDAQLDQLLETANEELLDHVKATADHNRTLTALMAQNTAHPTQHDPTTDNQTAALMIRARSRASDLASGLASASDTASAGDLDLARRIARVGDLAHAHDLARARALARVGDLAHARALARGIARDLDLASDLARVGDLARVADVARSLAFELAGASASASALARAHDLGSDLASDLARVFALAGALADALRDARDRAYALADNICAQPVDASGADLSDAEIEHLGLLDGVVWTARTTWPPGIGGQVREHSREVRPGVYQVRLGDVQDHHGAARV